MKVALGLDIGTTAVKAIALDEEGRVVARAGAAHDLMTPHPGWAEGDPDAWWANAIACIRRVGQDYRDLYARLAPAFAAAARG